MNIKKTSRKTPIRRKTTGRGQSDAGRSTREAIVSAAERLLINQGYASFSLPAVARELGISHGNLNYYFPTRQSLLETLIEHLLGKYHARFLLMRSPTNVAATASIGNLIDWLLDDAVSRQTNRLFRELWAMANHDRYVATALNRLQDVAVRQIVDVVGGSSGHANLAQLETASFLLAIIVDGATASFGTRRQSDPRVVSVRRMAKKTLTDLLEQEPGNRATD